MDTAGLSGSRSTSLWSQMRCVCKSHSSRVQSIWCTKTSLTAWWPFCLLSHGEPLRKHTSLSDWCQHTVMFGFLGMHDILVTIWRYWPILSWFKLSAYQQLSRSTMSSWTKYVIHQQHWRNVTYICRKCEIIISVKLYIIYHSKFVSFNYSLINMLLIPSAFNLECPGLEKNPKYPAIVAIFNCSCALIS